MCRGQGGVNVALLPSWRPEETDTSGELHLSINIVDKSQRGRDVAIQTRESNGCDATPQRNQLRFPFRHHREYYSSVGFSKTSKTSSSSALTVCLRETLSGTRQQPIIPSGQPEGGEGMPEEGGGCGDRRPIQPVSNEVVLTSAPLFINQHLVPHCPFVCPGEMSTDGCREGGASARTPSSLKPGSQERKKVGLEKRRSGTAVNHRTPELAPNVMI